MKKLIQIVDIDKFDSKYNCEKGCKMLTDRKLFEASSVVTFNSLQKTFVAYCQLHLILFFDYFIEIFIFLKTF